MAVCLNRQIFYVPPVVAGPEPVSCGFWVQEEGPSAAIFGVPLSPPLLQNAHDPQPSSVGGSQADAILIPSDDEFDDLDGRSDTSFKSLDGLLSDARDKQAKVSTLLPTIAMRRSLRLLPWPAQTMNLLQSHRRGRWRRTDQFRHPLHPRHPAVCLCARDRLVVGVTDVPST
jgi:hypothetical protein